MGHKSQGVAMLCYGGGMITLMANGVCVRDSPIKTNLILPLLPETATLSALFLERQDIVISEKSRSQELKMNKPFSSSCTYQSKARRRTGQPVSGTFVTQIIMYYE
ncbi:hypothetical protein DL93DRAFT_1466975 [Clavulina sp. PMI_390]|nr:hypothetical protein DL93DRAFT_1466975 [Clavulina sp. PMI_390]